MIDHKVAKKGNMSVINGINYGCPYEGYFDPYVILFQNIYQHYLHAHS